MSIKEITSQEEWDKFVFSQPFYTFINSWHWGEFNRLMGSKIFRLGFYDDNYKLLGISLVIKVEAKRGTHLFCPYGPLINEKNEKYFEVLRMITGEIKKIALKEKASFIRINPIIEGTAENAEKLKKLGLKFSPIHVHAEDTWLLDITKNEDEILNGMRKTAKYLIKRAAKEGVEVRKDNSEEYIKKFIAMHRHHAARSKGNNYIPFSENYIFNLFKAFPEENINLLYARYNDFIEAILVSIKYGKTTAYYLGASDVKNPKFSPAYLLQWEAIKKAQQEGCTFYNFWGVAPDENSKHPLSGVTLFKKGFGGYPYNLIHVHDLAITPKYWLNYAVESMRRIRRGYYYKK